jgi:hypothetical protein
MKKWVFVLLASVAFSGRAATLYVAPNGDDSALGTKEQPLATLSGARDTVRKMIAADQGQLKKPVTVLFRGGIYPFDETVVFGLQDSGSSNAAITYAAYENEQPVFSGGIPVRGWKRTQLKEGNIWAASVPWVKSEQRFHALFDGEKLLQRSRSKRFWNTRELHKAPAWEGDKPRWHEWMHEQSRTYLKTLRDEYRKLHSDETLLEDTENIEDVELFIRPSAKWLVNYLPLKSYDPKTGVLETSIEGTYPLVREFYLENALEFLDEPGEWSLDTRRGLLFYWPETGTPGDRIVAPRLPALVRVEGRNDLKGYADRPARGLVFKGLTFTHCNRDVWQENDIGIQHDWDMWDKENALLRFRGAEDCVVDGCRFVNSGSGAVRVDLHGQRIKIQNNKIRNVGGTGVLLSGYGPGLKDVNHDNLILNNEIENTGTLYWHGIGVFVWQSGKNRIAHNRIHNLGYTGMVISGVRVRFFGQGNLVYYRGDDPERREYMKAIRWSETGKAGKDEDWANYEPYMHARENLIEYNEIFNCMQRLIDGNCIYLSATGKRNVVRRNLMHSHVKNNMLRTDDDQFDTLATENIIIGNGSHYGFALKHVNTFENNILIDSIISGQAAGGGPQPGSVIKRNIVFQLNPEVESCISGRMFRHLNPEDIDYNLYYMERAGAAVACLSGMREQGWDKHSRVADPLFADIRNLDFRFKRNSPAFDLGIKPIEGLETIGLLHDPALPRLRKTGGLDAMKQVELQDSEVFIKTGHRPSLMKQDK